MDRHAAIELEEGDGGEDGAANQRPKVTPASMFGVLKEGQL
jgi:hypothetical protein